MMPTKLTPHYQIFKFGLTALLIFPVIADANSAPKEWYCKVSAFTSTYDAIGSSRAEATLAATQKCAAENHSMHCKKIECEGPDENTSGTHSNDEDSDSNHGWICTLTPFSERYSASGNTRANAKLKVMKMCEKTQNKMFCENPDCVEG